MHPPDFKIGLEFWCGHRRWRCTDIGTRVITAIRVDVTEATVLREDGMISVETLSGAQAEAYGAFSGPPYTVREVVFDEYDLDGCSLQPDPRAAEVHYIGIVDPAEDGSWGIVFPDLPGCTSAGWNDDDLRSNAIEAIRLWAEPGEDLPRARDQVELLSDPEVRVALKAAGPRGHLLTVPAIMEE